MTGAGAEPKDLVATVSAALNPFNLYTQPSCHTQVGKALLTGAGAEPKDLVATVSGEGKPPVKLMVLDTEEQEAAVIAQVIREGNCKRTAMLR